MTTTELETTPQTAAIAAKVSPWPDRAREVAIADQPSFDAASELLKGIKALKEEVGEAFDPIVAKAYSAHREATTQRKRQLDPLEDAERIIKQKMNEFLLAQERIRQVEQRRLQAIADAEAAAALEAQVEQAEANGASQAEVEAIIDDAPPATVVPYVAPAVETKGTGIFASLRITADVADLDQFIAYATKTEMVGGKVKPKYPQLWALLEVNPTKLRSITKAMGKSLGSVPGLRVTEQRGIAVRGK